MGEKGKKKFIDNITPVEGLERGSKRGGKPGSKPRFWRAQKR